MYCRIAREPIDVTELMQQVRSDEDGAVIVFTGVVRNHDRGRPVEGLEYAAYEAMAVGALERICDDVQASFDIGDVAVVHRVGELAIGETSVAIAVAAPHRDAAYGACREIIERLKREVPIWKRERYVGGREEWLEGVAPEVPHTK